MIRIHRCALSTTAVVDGDITSAHSCCQDTKRMESSFGYNQQMPTQPDTVVFSWCYFLSFIHALPLLVSVYVYLVVVVVALLPCSTSLAYDPRSISSMYNRKITDIVFYFIYFLLFFCVLLSYDILACQHLQPGHYIWSVF